MTLVLIRISKDYRGFSTELKNLCSFASVFKITLTVPPNDFVKVSHVPETKMLENDDILCHVIFFSS